MGLFGTRGRSPDVLDIDGPTDDIDRLFKAVDELNQAWALMPRSVSPWIDWKNRRITVQTRETKAESHSRASLRDELERRQDLRP